MYHQLVGQIRTLRSEEFVLVLRNELRKVQHRSRTLICSSCSYLLRPIFMATVQPERSVLERHRREICKRIIHNEQC